MEQKQAFFTMDRTIVERETPAKVRRVALEGV